MLWFTADQHIKHKNIIKFCNRPFADVVEMREEIIRRHNEIVCPNDTVYNVGDTFWRFNKPDEVHDYLAALNGRQVYVLGNHEEAIRDYFNKYPESPLFGCLYERLYLRNDFTGTPGGIVLDHYAGLVWQNSHNGSYQLFGHSHGKLNKVVENMPGLLSMDVGVDSHNFYPVSLDQVKATMEKKAKALNGKPNSTPQVG
jgi:calcineurin-like phosphoesterase family protein